MSEINYTKRRAEVAARLLTGEMPKHFRFSMRTYGAKEPKNVCNTVGCIAGLAVEMYYGHQKALREEKSVSALAEEILGLTRVEGGNLFEPNNYSRGIMFLYDITELRAGRVLAEFVLTKKIDWSKRDEPIKIGSRVF